MKFIRAVLLALLLPIAASAGFLSISRGPVFVEPSQQVDTGSLVTTGTIDGVTDRLDILAEGTAADVGAGDFTFSLWLKPNAAGNDTGAQTTGVGYKFPDTDIVIDRDNLDETRDFGCGLAAGRFGCSVQNGNGSYSVFSTTDITDAQWHHLYWQRSASDGLMRIWVDGDLQVSDTGPTGTISLDPGVCQDAECFLVFYTEKHGFQVEGFKGKGGPIEIWETLVCSSDPCTVPSAPSDPDSPGLVAQYLMGEGSGTVVADSAGTNDGFIAAGGVPAWDTDTPYP